MNYEYIKEEINKLKSEITRLKSEIAVLPPGKIYCTKSDRQLRWYHSDGHSPQYISMSNQQLIARLVQKKFAEALKQYYEIEYRNLSTLLSKHDKNANNSLRLLNSPEYNQFLTPFQVSPSVKNNSWATEPYDINTSHPEQLEHPCKSGHVVRSKSEYMIDTALYETGLIFRYECRLILGEVILYPDFMIMHPVTKEIYIWEHFGLINRQSYANQAFDKLKIYASNNYYPDINLITTYETPNHPLTYTEIEQTIQKFFLAR